MPESTVLVGRFVPGSLIPRVARLLGSLTGIFVLVASPDAALGQVHFSNSNLEVSGAGPRISRNCTVLLKPALTFGESTAPRLVLVTNGLSRLSFGVERPSQYSGVVIVQDNMRRPSAAIENGSSLQQFRVSEIGKAISSGRLFFVTAQRSDTRDFVSSRYERIDFDAVLSRVELACSFDAENLMANTATRESAERMLSILSPDLTLIRWALNKKYGGASAKPEPRTFLTELERSHLKRYASDSGLPASGYLTAETARKLVAEGQLLAKAELPAAPVYKPAFWSFNDSKMSLKAESDKPERIFVYDEPSTESRSAGVTSGAVAFNGVRARDRYKGKAYAFSRRCPPAAYDVVGIVSDDQRQVTLTGRAPRRDGSCKVMDYRDETLVFRFHDIEDNWGEPRR